MESKEQISSEGEPKIEVLCRFRPSELDKMRRETGAEGAGTAVAAFVRKRLAEGEK